MTFAALTLVVLASSIHAGWNLLAKRAADRLGFLWLVLGAGLLLYGPAALVAALLHPPPAEGFLFIAVSGMVHAAYYGSLSRMYRYDFSLTYPTARGSSPVLVTLFSLTVLREPLTTGGLAGIGLVVCGIAALQVQTERGPAGRTFRWPVADVLRGPAGRQALATGAIIACYSLVDKAGVALVNPVLYIWCSHLVAFAFWSLLIRRRWGAAVGQGRRAWKAVLAAAAGQNLAYILVLFAMRLAPVAYVVPAREMSTLVGAGLGVVLLKEPFPASKLGGAALIAAGVALIAALG